jgi:enoyl-CoA hydratase/carnithine racemase
MDVHVNAATKVATLAGVADAPFDRLVIVLESFIDGDAVRAVILGLEDAGSMPAFFPDEALWLQRFPLPCIAAASGELTSLALQLALSCDIRVCDRDTVFAGLPVGSARLLSLVSEAAPRAKSLAAAQRLAATIASRGPIATRMAKESLWRGREMPLETALRFETDLTLLLQTTKDRAEGIAAFLEKRTPTFTGN